MAQKLDQIIIVDIESTCWEERPPAGQQSEIIEIGACLLDLTTLQRSAKTSILVRPTRSTVSEFCTRLTTLTQSQVDTGISFAEACARLQREYGARERTWASFGDYDRVTIQRQCDGLGIAYPFNRTHLNIKNLLALGLNLPKEADLDKALKLLGLHLEGTHHRGDDDAWNIAAIMAIILGQQRAGASQ
jgi:inhibitor of KinA sporulation pathway (predicted exonuclease)